MKLLPRVLLLASVACLAGCSLLPDSKRDQAQLNERLQNDDDERKARLKAKGTLSPQEYEIMARKMGWTTEGKAGLPPPPSVEELEKRVKAAEARP
ncbi:MAG: hypothetical protein ACO34G_03190 [Opitutales bacterium]